MASAAAAKKCPRPSNCWSADEPQVRLVDQGGGVEGVAGGFGGHARGGELPQLVVDEREQVGGGLAVAGRGGVEEAGHVGHAAECNRGVAAGNSKAVGKSPVVSPDGYVAPAVFLGEPVALERRARSSLPPRSATARSAGSVVADHLPRTGRR